MQQEDNRRRKIELSLEKERQRSEEKAIVNENRGSLETLH